MDDVTDRRLEADGGQPDSHAGGAAAPVRPLADREDRVGLAMHKALCWTNIRPLVTYPTFVVAAIPVLAFLADHGVAFPPRTKLSVLGAVLALVAWAVAKARCPESVAHAGPGNDQDAVAKNELAEALRRDLIAFRAELPEADVVRTLFRRGNRDGKSFQDALTAVRELSAADLVGTTELVDRVPRRGLRATALLWSMGAVLAAFGLLGHILVVLV